MLYLDNRPLNPSRRHAANGPDRFYQWRGFFDDNSELDDIVQIIEKDFTEKGTSDHIDRYFLLPGRSNTITTLCDNETLEVHTMVSAEGALEKWERSVKTTFPMSGQQPLLSGLMYRNSAVLVLLLRMRKASQTRCLKSHAIMKRTSIAAIMSAMMSRSKSRTSTCMGKRKSQSHYALRIHKRSRVKWMPSD